MIMMMITKETKLIITTHTAHTHTWTTKHIFISTLYHIIFILFSKTNTNQLSQREERVQVEPLGVVMCCCWSSNIFHQHFAWLLLFWFLVFWFCFCFVGGHCCFAFILSLNTARTHALFICLYCLCLIRCAPLFVVLFVFVHLYFLFYSTPLSSSSSPAVLSSAFYT